MNFTKIITHPGIFHADDATAVALLQRVVGFEAPLPVERKSPSREELADPAVICVDVGGEFSAAAHNYDHHQTSFRCDRDPAEGYGIPGRRNPLAAAGLVWTQFQRGIAPVGLPPEDRELWHMRFDGMLIRGIDAVDCGVEKAPSGAPPSISQCVSWLNPTAGAAAEHRDRAFDRAVEMMGRVIDAAFSSAVHWCQGCRTVQEAPVTDHVMELPCFVPWQEHILSRSDQDDILFVVFPSERGGYVVQQVPVMPGSFEGRKPLPKTWAGLRGAELASLTGVADATFCHSGRFIAGAESLAGTMKLAKKAVRAFVNTSEGRRE